MSRRLALILLTIIAGACAILVRINLQFDQPQGRYLFPALPAIALMIAIGFESWRVPAPARLTVAALAVVNLLILVLVVLPAYPPNVPAISKALTTVQADHANGDWVGNVRVATKDALFVIFDLEGGRETSQSGESPAVQGQAVVTVDNRDITLPFTWLPDGQRRTMYLTLLPNAPAGTVTGIRIRPGAAAAVRQLRIAGSIPSHDF